LDEPREHQLTSAETAFHEPPIADAGAADVVDEPAVLDESDSSASHEWPCVSTTYQKWSYVEDQPVGQPARQETRMELSSPLNEQSGNAQRGEEAESLPEIQTIGAPVQGLDTNAGRGESPPSPLRRRLRAQDENRTIFG
jgi:hypothetical protein